MNEHDAWDDPGLLNAIWLALEQTVVPDDDEVADLEDGSIPTAEWQFIGEDEASDPEAVEREARKLNSVS